MSPNEISEIIDTAFSESFKQWEKNIESELYPEVFADQYSWLRVKNAIKINNLALKNALKLALCKMSDCD